jgi:hypothetical protein
MKIQGRKVPAIYNYVGVRDDGLANRLAWREIRENSYPLAKLRAKVDRSFWDTFIGEVIMFSWEFEDFSVSDIPFRVIKIDWGNAEHPEIVIDAVQDVFSWRAASFADSDTSAWILPDQALIPFPAVDQIAFESPRAFNEREENTAEGRVWAGGTSQGREEAGYEIRQRNGSSSPAGNYYTAGDATGFIWDGALSGAISNSDVTIDVITNMNIAELVTSTGYDVGEYLYNLFMIDDELIVCTGVSEITGGLRLTGCLRGICDTAQAIHSDTAVVYFLHDGGELTDTVFDPTYNVDLKLLPYDQVGNKVSESDPGITVLDLDLDNRALKPYPPTFVDWNSVQYPATVDIASDVLVEFNRRDYRIFNEYSQHDTDAETINGDFPANNSTMYRLYLYSGVSVVHVGDWNAGAASLTLALATILRYADGLPTTLKIGVHTKHEVSAADYEADQDVVHEAAVESSIYDDDFYFGICSPSTPCPNTWTAPDTGTYGFVLDATISGDVEARINGGSWQQVVIAGNLTGNLVGVTASDTIEVQHLDSSSSDEVLLTVGSPISSEDAFGILIFA